jgi:hypothetical protein
MSHLSRPIIGLATASLLVASAGCDAASFTALNQNLAEIKKASALNVDVRLPTAAIATALGGLELLKALSKPSGSAGKPSGGLVAAGGLNYKLLDLSPGIGKVEKVDANNVTAEVKYDSTVQADGSVTSEIAYFKGKTNGYDIDAKGSFTYKSAARGSGGVLGSVNAAMPGSIKHKDLDFSIKTLSFATQDPLPPDAANIGNLELFVKLGKDETTLKAAIGVEKSKIKAEARVIVNGKEQPDVIKFDQDNPNLADGVAASK